MNWLSPPRVRGALRVGSAVLGIGVTGWLLATLWPEPDRVAQGAPLSADQPETLAPFPESPVTVLLIGLDANRLGAPTNQAAPKAPANADALAAQPDIDGLLIGGASLTPGFIDCVNAFKVKL